MTSDQTATPLGITIVEDENGIAVMGDPAVVEPWLSSHGLPSREVPANATRVLGAASKVFQVGADVSANSGRWVKLTKESAELVAKAGASPTSGVVRNNAGQIVKHLKFEQIGKAALGNPGVMAGVGGVMAQMALEQAIAEITDYLAAIDKKVDDLLRDQKDQALADLVGISLAVEEAKLIRDRTGTVGPTTWSKVSQCGAGLGRAQGYALAKVEGLARGLEQAGSAGDVHDAARKVEADLQDWLQVLARATQLQDMLWVVELERVLVEDPEHVLEHRAGIAAARTQRLEQMESALGSLGQRVTAAAALAVDKKLLNPVSANRAVKALDHAATQLTTFADHAGLAASATVTEAPRWREIAGNRIATLDEEATEFVQHAADEVKELGMSTVEKSRELGDTALDGIREAGERITEVDLRSLVRRPSLPSWARRSKD